MNVTPVELSEAKRNMLVLLCAEQPGQHCSGDSAFCRVAGGKEWDFRKDRVQAVSQKRWSYNNRHFTLIL